MKISVFLIFFTLLFGTRAWATPLSGFPAKEFLIKCKGYPNPVKTSLFLSASLDEAVNCHWKLADNQAAPGAEGDYNASFTLEKPVVLSIKTANYQVSQPDFQFISWRSSEPSDEVGCSSFSEFHFHISDGKKTYTVGFTRADQGIAIWSGTMYGEDSPLCTGTAK